MRTRCSLLAAVAAALVLLATAGALAQVAYKIESAGEIKWVPAPPSLPPGAEAVSGTFRLGMGEKADKSKTHVLPAGSFLRLLTRHGTLAFVDEGTVIHLNSTAPWGPYLRQPS